MRRVGLLLGMALALGACSSDQPPPPREDGGESGDAQGETEAGVPDAAIAADAGPIGEHDGGGPLGCGSSCDCPQGQACLNGACRTLGAPIWCCENPGCPPEAPCLNASEQPSQCPGMVPAPDAGVSRPDAGPQGVGGECALDHDCVSGLTCWTRNEPPGMWGYCTQENCTTGSCPADSECFQFGNPPTAIGCLKLCVSEADCRVDAHCFPVPGFGGSVCLTDCRDDVLDCGVRNGSEMCTAATGDCQVTPSHNTGATIGDPCQHSNDCNINNVCMSEAGWPFPGGMCTQSCLGLPESSACPAGHTCQPFPPFSGIGFCVRDCVNNACPNRPNTACTTFDPSWSSPGCVPQ